MHTKIKMIISTPTINVEGAMNGQVPSTWIVAKWI